MSQKHPNEDSLRKKVQKEINAAKWSARRFRTVNWTIPILIAAIGIFISSDITSSNTGEVSPKKTETLERPETPETPETPESNTTNNDNRIISILLGAVSASLAVCHKTVEPGIKAEFHSKRTRGLEYIEAEIDNKKKKFSEEELRVLTVRTKENPDKVIQVFNILYDNFEGEKLKTILTEKDGKDMAL